MVPVFLLSLAVNLSRWFELELQEFEIEQQQALEGSNSTEVSSISSNSTAEKVVVVGIAGTGLRYNQVRNRLNMLEPLTILIPRIVLCDLLPALDYPADDRHPATGCLGLPQHQDLRQDQGGAENQDFGTAKQASAGNRLERSFPQTLV